MNYDKEIARDVPPPIPGTVSPMPGQSPMQQAAQGVQPAPGAQTPQEPMPASYLIWSVLATVFCCLVPGIVAIIFSSQVSSKYYAGDIEGARKASRNAEIWIIVSFVLGVLSATLYLPIALIN
ncbi:MAG: CD225/dispanin family protein [Muribaculaceae bacterium]|nr:CD225/dispanin family protein [Muribaculaceae bacterium]